MQGLMGGAHGMAGHVFLFFFFFAIIKGFSIFDACKSKESRQMSRTSDTYWRLMGVIDFTER